MQLKHSLLFSTLALCTTPVAATTFEAPNFYGDILGQVAGKRDKIISQKFIALMQASKVNMMLIFCVLSIT